MGGGDACFGAAGARAGACRVRSGRLVEAVYGAGAGPTIRCGEAFLALKVTSGFVGIEEELFGITEIVLRDQPG